MLTWLSTPHRTLREWWDEWWCIRNNHQPHTCSECRRESDWAFWVVVGGTIRASHLNEKPGYWSLL